MIEFKRFIKIFWGMLLLFVVCLAIGTYYYIKAEQITGWQQLGQSMRYYGYSIAAFRYNSNCSILYGLEMEKIC